MKIETRREASTVIVSPRGRLDAAGGSVLEAELATLLIQGARVVLDCGGVDYISSAGLRALLVCAKACQRAGGQLTLAALTPECRSVLVACGFLSIIAHRDTVEAALAER